MTERTIGALNSKGRSRMAIHWVKCFAGCGGVLRHYEELAPNTWAHASTDPVVFEKDGKVAIACPECGAVNVVQSPHVQGVIEVIGLFD